MTVPRTLSSWYSLSTEAWVFPPSTTTSSTAFSPPAPVSAVRRSRSGIEIATGASLSVENARDQPLPAQAARLGGAEDRPVLDHELDALSCHGAGL